MPNTVMPETRVPVFSLPDTRLQNNELRVIDDIHTVIHLLSSGQILCSQVKGAAGRLCEEVKQVTGNRVQLSLQKGEKVRHVIPSPHISMILPVQFGHTVYGSLYITTHSLDMEQPSISLLVAQLLAQVCSWLLYTLEQTTFLQSQCQHIEYYMQEPLTKREREVLELMFRGCDQDEIADKLCIAPATVNKHRQHVYERLGVHNEREALLAAYQMGILSVFDDFMAQNQNDR